MKIKLGELPNTRVVNMNIALSFAIKAARYAQLYSKNWPMASIHIP
jgi:hypothetical protein